MQPLSCQKGFVIPIIVIIIAAFSIGLAGPVVYPRIKTQVEQITKPKPTPMSEQSTEFEQSSATQSAGESQKPVVNINVETKIAQESEEKSEPEMKEKQVKEDDEDKAKGTGKKDEEEQGQRKEGIEDEPPLNLTFKALDFNKLYPLISNLPIPTPKPLTSLIGKIKVYPGLFSSSSPTPSPTPTPVLPRKAIVVVLDTVKVHDDEDPALNGEIQIVTSTRTGFTEQVTAWPVKNWDEADSGNTLKIDRPIFILPKDLVDEKLGVWISVVENDSLPSSATGLINKSLKISEGSALLLADPATFLAAYALEKALDKFLDWLGGEEHIGTLATVLYKSQNFGMGSENKKSFTTKKGNATITYTVWELTIPEKPLRVDIKVKKVKVYESGDIWPNDGDLYIWTYVSDGFDGREPHGFTTRIPKKGTHTKEDDSTWNVDQEIISITTQSPVLYYEIGVWDDDGSTSNDDQLEIVTDTLYINVHTPGEVIQASKDGDDGVDASATIEREVRFFAAD